MAIHLQCHTEDNGCPAIVVGVAGSLSMNGRMHECVRWMRMI